MPSIYVYPFTYKDNMLTNVVNVRGIVYILLILLRYLCIRNNMFDHILMYVF